MKLYDVPRSTYIKAFNTYFLFTGVDGMYSKCWDKDNNLIYLSPLEDVEVLESCPW